MKKIDKECENTNHNYEYQRIRDGEYDYKEILYCRKCGKIKEI